MLPGKGKHGFKRTGKGGKDIGKVVPSTSKSKESPSGKAKAKDLDLMDDRDGVISSLPLFRMADNSRMLPRYTAVLARSEEEGVGMEDLDTLQLELEALLSCVAVRNRVIREEIKLLESAEEKRDKKTKLALTSGVKRGAANRSEDRPIKILKDSLRSDVSVPGKLNKVKGPPGAADIQSKDTPKPDAPKIVIHKNDTPNKFWASVEPYCSPISQDDLTYLEELIKTREKERNSDLMKIPPLGKHYCARWADEDLGDEVKRRNEPTERLGRTAGPLTQRLLSAFIEEKISPLQETNENKGNRDISSHRQSSIKNVQSLSFERRVRKELREQGILDGDEAPKEQADDELLLEIKRVQGELQVISQHNLQQLKHLHGLAVSQMQRQELKRKIKGIDTELLNIFASKQKKKHFTKKEKDQAWRFIKEREQLLKQLYAINGSQ
ncbi:hypothetical protein RUM43_012822 [Polyplax serrata]|uniref:Transcriptional adapter 3 n=1 Tax=Polyplax serrata TaxID=468196 RepID=A0AAN8PTR3_POLSC